jgi:hypothetical protein
MKRDLAEARPACDKAVTLASTVGFSSRGGIVDKTATAQALSNRGVMRAVGGDATGAAADFKRAAKFERGTAAASRNLAHLQSVPADRVARVAGSAE